MAAEAFELSFQQKRMWSAATSAPDFCTRCTVALSGELDVSALRRALYEVVDHHEILHIIFPRGEGGPVQAVGPVTFDWNEDDLTHMPPASREARLEEISQIERRHTFDFERGPLVRARLIALTSQQYKLLLQMPSLCGDAATLRIVFDEIALRYAGEEKPPAADRFQYIDCSAWQDELFEEQNAEADRGRRYWSDERTANLALALPFEREATADFELLSCSIAISAAS
ncbi:MAG TPA: condensation domain-containing protein, partial [Rhodocyclaceae bacterium]|nr:condensation domain-containing protein [Rhodocyclaceae bacterium]